MKGVHFFTIIMRVCDITRSKILLLPLNILLNLFEFDDYDGLVSEMI